MNARLLAAFLCLASASTGCIIIDNDPDPCCTTNPPPTGQGGDVTFLWTLGNDSGRCADYPDVKNVRISIPGETLHNGGIYACNTANVDGITLHDFAPKSYSYTIEAIGYDNRVLFKGAGSFSVNGNVRVNINLTPGGQSYAYISWYFPPNGVSNNPSCSQAGVTAIKASFDNGEWLNLNCAGGMTGAGVPSPYLQPGNHTVHLIAYGWDKADRENVPLYNVLGTFETRAGSPNSVQFKFFELGGMSLRWQLWDGYANAYKTCAEAGLTGMTINLRDTVTGELVFGTNGDPQSCTGAPVVYQFLKPGNYEVYIRGYTGDTRVYTNENAATKTVLTVRALEQRTSADTADLVTLERI